MRAVKILCSLGYGAGWSTWISSRDMAALMLTDVALIKCVEEYGTGDPRSIAAKDALLDRIEEASGMRPYDGGFHGLVVREVEPPFRIAEHDGSECVVEVRSDPNIWCEGDFAPEVATHE